jgi:hypothetical protein
MIDSIAPNKTGSIQKIKRVIENDDKSPTSKPSKKVAAENSEGNSEEQKRKGSFIDEQI